MNYLNNLKNILSNKKFNYIILLTTIGLLNGNNIYASSNEETEPDALLYLHKIYIDFLKENQEKYRKVSEEYAATLLNKNRDRIKNAFPLRFKVNFRGTSCISRCCRRESFADSSVFVSNSKAITIKSIVVDTFRYNIQTRQVLYMPMENKFFRYLQNILFVCFDESFSGLKSSLEKYYKKNKDNYNYSMPDITDETFSYQNIAEMLFRKVKFDEILNLQSTIHSTTQE
ncbi:MAG: hypothetical protein II393_01090 [Cytophagales bacterium]|nr:hypothetical protein [Cytophagales bacterium]